MASSRATRGEEHKKQCGREKIIGGRSPRVDHKRLIGQCAPDGGGEEEGIATRRERGGCNAPTSFKIETYTA